jgi:hypothetical protein
MRRSVVSLGLLFHLWHGSRFTSSHFLTCSQHQSLKYNPMHNLQSNARKRHSNERQHGPSHQATLVAQAVRQQRRPQLCLRMASGHCTTCLRPGEKKNLLPALLAEMYRYWNVGIDTVRRLIVALLPKKIIGPFTVT